MISPTVWAMPNDSKGRDMPLLPSYRTLMSVNNTTLSTTATDIALTSWTRLLRMMARGVDVFLNFTNAATDTVTTSSFDAVILADMWWQDYVIPAWCTTINAVTAAGTVTNFIIIWYEWVE